MFEEANVYPEEIKAQNPRAAAYLAQPQHKFVTFEEMARRHEMQKARFYAKLNRKMPLFDNKSDGKYSSSPVVTLK